MNFEVLASRCDEISDSSREKGEGGRGREKGEREKDISENSTNQGLCNKYL